LFEGIGNVVEKGSLHHWLIRLAVAFVGLPMLSISLSADAPTLRHLYPAGGSVASSVSIHIVGDAKPWPPNVWAEHKGIAFVAQEKEKEFKVSIAADVKPGVYFIRLFNQEGASAPCQFVVTDQVEILELEPNDHFREPQPIKPRVAWVNGRLDKGGDVDTYSVWLEEGESLMTKVEAFSLGSTTDTLLHLRDYRGQKLDYNHDHIHFDPKLNWKAQYTGLHLIQIMGFAYPAKADIRLGGGDDYVYRMFFARGPILSHTVPLEIETNQTSRLDLKGFNLPQSILVPTELSREQSPETQFRQFFNQTLGWQPDIRYSSTSQFVENEPNQKRTKDKPFAIPFGMTGSLNGPLDVDRYSFQAIKDRLYSFSINSSKLGFPTDSWIRIEDSEAKQLAYNDDGAGKQDPKVEWTAPADDIFFISVGSLNGQTGAEAYYHLSAASPKSRMDLVPDTHTFSIVAGTTNTIKIAAKNLYKFSGTNFLNALHLPKGVTASPVPIPPKDGEISFNLVATENAAPWNGHFNLIESISNSSRTNRLQALLSKSSINNGVPQGFPNLLRKSIDELWLTVLPQKPATQED
jgi:hypothetical protein